MKQDEAWGQSIHFIDEDGEAFVSPEDVDVEKVDEE